MERHEEQEGTGLEARRAEAQEEIRRKIAEYETALESARQSLEQLRAEAERKVRERQAELASRGARGERKEPEQAPAEQASQPGETGQAEAPAHEAAATQPIERELQHEAAAERVADPHRGPGRRVGEGRCGRGEVEPVGYLDRPSVERGVEHTDHVVPDRRWLREAGNESDRHGMIVP